VLVALGLAFPALFLRELARPAPRPDLVRSVTATGCGVMAVAATGLWVTGGRTAHFLDLAAVAGCAGAAACLVIGLSRILKTTRRDEADALAGVVGAALAGCAASFAVGTPWFAGLAVGAACGVAPGALWLVGAPRKVFSGRFATRDLALGALPLAVAAVPVWAAQLMR
jgi:hypothetical protein